MNTNIRIYSSIIQCDIDLVISVIASCIVDSVKASRLALNNYVIVSLMVSVGVGLNYFMRWRN